MTSKEQERPKVPKSRIPTFKTIEEEAAFWDTHSSEDFADELTPVEDVKFVKARSRKALTVRVDEETFEELTREASEKGIGPSTLARMVILVQDSTNVFIYDSRPEADREPQSSERTCDTLYLEHLRA